MGALFLGDTAKQANKQTGCSRYVINIFLPLVVAGTVVFVVVVVNVAVVVVVYWFKSTISRVVAVAMAAFKYTLR